MLADAIYVRRFRSNAFIRVPKAASNYYSDGLLAVHGDVVVTMGHETVVPVSGPEAGKDVHRRYTDIWMKQDGEWKLVARQATVIAP